MEPESAAGHLAREGEDVASYHKVLLYSMREGLQYSLRSLIETVI